MYEQISSNKRKSYFLFTIIIAIIVFLGYVFGFFYGAPYEGISIAVVISLIYVLIGYYAGSKMILAVSGAKEAKKPEHTYLINTVEGLAIAAGIPKPKVYVMNEEAINAFAAGRNPENSVVAVTTGAILLLVGIVLAIVAPILAQLIRLAISRKMEYLADANGALLTRFPKGLADALKKIKKEHLPVRRATPSKSSRYVANPLKSEWFAAQPNGDKRISALEKR